MMYSNHNMDVVIFDANGEVCAWLVDDGSDMETESYNPNYEAK